MIQKHPDMSWALPLTKTPRYVLGFAFDKNDNVVLVQKTKPAWQAGKLNGVGGRIEDFDTSDSEAMRREFLEETGQETDAADWQPIAFMHGAEWDVTVFVFTQRWEDASSWEGRQTDTDEVLRVIKIHDIFRDKRVISNLPWLIGLCLDPDMRTGHYSLKNIPVV